MQYVATVLIHAVEYNLYRRGTLALLTFIPAFIPLQEAH